MLLRTILPLFPLLSTRLLDLARLAHSNQSVVRLELLHRLNRIVDQGETCRLAAAVLGAHAEDVDLVFVGFVDFGEFGAEVVFFDVGAVRVQDITGVRGVSDLSYLVCFIYSVATKRRVLA